MKKILLTLAMVIFAAFLFATSALAKDFVAYWSFDENANEEINGFAPSNPEAFTQVEGKHGKAYGGALSDGSGVLHYEWINIDQSAEFTFSAWVKASAEVENGGWYVLYARNKKNTDGHFEVYINPEGKIVTYMMNKQHTVADVPSNGSFNDGNWHHVAVTCKDKHYKLWIDGVVNNEADGELLGQGEGPLSIGGLVNGDFPCQAYIDDIFYVNRLLSDEDIKKLMDDSKSYAYNLAGVTAPAAPVVSKAPAAPTYEGDFVAYWSFDENANEAYNGFTPENPNDISYVDGVRGKAFGGANIDNNTGMAIYRDVLIPITDNFTVALWFKHSMDIQAGWYYVFFAKNQKMTPGHFELYFEPTGNVASYATNESEALRVTSDGPYDDDQWHHYVMTCTDGEVQVYIDGNLIAQAYQKEPFALQSGDLFFGSLVDSTLVSHTQIDEVFIYNHPVSADDVAKIMEDTAAFAASVAPAAPASPAVENTAVIESADAVVNTPVVAAPKTADASVIAVFAAIVSLGYAVVIKKRG